MFKVNRPTNNMSTSNLFYGPNKKKALLCYHTLVNFLIKSLLRYKI